MRIHQLNIKYESDQDRLLARINTNTGLEMRLWFTRRLTVGLLPLLRKMVGQQTDQVAVADADALTAKDPLVRQVLSEFKKEEVLRQSDFKTPFKEPVVGAALTEPPLLVSEVALTPLANGRLHTRFKGPTDAQQQRQEIQLELDSQLMHGFLHLLEKAYAASQWALVTVAPIDLEPAAATAASDTRPQYLN